MAVAAAWIALLSAKEAASKADATSEPRAGAATAGAETSKPRREAGATRTLAVLGTNQPAMGSKAASEAGEPRTAEKAAARWEAQTAAEAGCPKTEARARVLAVAPEASRATTQDLRTMKVEQSTEGASEGWSHDRVSSRGGPRCEPRSASVVRRMTAKTARAGLRVLHPPSACPDVFHFRIRAPRACAKIVQKSDRRRWEVSSKCEITRGFRVMTGRARQGSPCRDAGPSRVRSQRV